ncbi:MAG: T9SS type A sorting domain-containing protein [Bacteroidetes bacterium]|nr:MAG: T9SS type A sorting domain-containing protein [Bacteroidota bacterium]
MQFAICNLQSAICFAQYTKLLDFSGAVNGSNPYGSLVSDGTFLYGMTYSGGANSYGVTFKIKPDGTGYSKLLDFSGFPNGCSPLGSLISDGTFLYGMTTYCGTNSVGSIFKIKPDGTGYAKLLDFAGAANGQYPTGSFISDGAFLYGTTSTGGTNNMGTIFKIKPDGTGYAKLLDFAGATDGKNPRGSLISDGIFLYGMTRGGGINDLGVIFKIKPDGTGYARILDFSGAANGQYPNGSLMSDGAFLYGMTSQGGINNKGVIFKIKPDGTGYSKLLDFAGTVNGSGPTGSLISDGTFLYGMTDDGGASDLGTIFKIKTDGAGYVKLMDFSGAANGKWPYESLVSDGTFLYGMTYYGGTNDMGTVFKYQYNTAPACIASITGNATICAGQSVTLTASGGTTYSWNTGETATSIAVSPSANATYTVTAATGTCLATATAAVTVNPLPTISVSGNTSVCLGGCDTLTASGGVTYSWSPMGQTATSVILCPAITSSYTATGTDANGCANTAATSITVNSLPATPAITVNMSTLASGSAAGYQWYLNGNPISGATSQFHTATQNGLYSVCVTDANGCSSCSAPYNFSTTGIAENNNANDISVYPNPTNGIFTVTAAGYGYEIEIYNIMGEKIFQSVIQQFNSLLIDFSSQPSGVYFLQVKSGKESFTQKLIISLLLHLPE